MGIFESIVVGVSLIIAFLGIERGVKEFSNRLDKKLDILSQQIAGVYDRIDKLEDAKKHTL